MSLLLDALKRAEDAKRAKAEAASDAPVPDASGSHVDDVPAPTSPNRPGTISRDLRGAEHEPVKVQPEPASQKSSGDEHKPLPDYPLLTMEQVDSRPPDQVATPIATGDKPVAAQRPNANLNAAAASKSPMSASNVPVPAVLSPPALSLAGLLQAELPPGQKDSPAANRIAPSAATAAFRAARSPATQANGVAKPKAAATPLALEADEHDPVAAAALATQNAQRDAVKNVFAVKQANRQSAKSKWAIPIVVILLVGISAGSWYVWNEINAISRPNFAKSPTQAPVPPQNPALLSNAALPSAQTTPGSSGQTKTKSDGAVDGKFALAQSADASNSEATPDLPPLLPPLATALPMPKISATTAANVSPLSVTPREAFAKTIAALPVFKDPGTGPVKLRLATPLSQASLSPSIVAGYAALNNGDYALAKRHYAEAIAAETANIDANLGFATAAARSGEAAMAERYYRRVLEIDPRNATAATALLTLAGSSEALPPTTNLEAELRLLVAQDPNVAASHFALGNVYAAQRRWNEAQQSYFEAVRLAPQNPDYAYNLAVSLDQLRQTKSAEQFYRRALAAKGLAQFDRSVVERRVAALAAQGGQ